jgi:exodeoxyribonuclease-3
MASRLSAIILLLLIPAFTYAQQTVRILTYNVYEGFKNDSSAYGQFAKWAKEINPDIVALQEMNRFTQRGLEAFAAQYGHSYAVLSKTEGFPVALSSKYPIVNVQKVVDNMWHVYLYANVNGLHIFVVHLCPITYEKRRSEIRQVLAHAATLPKDAMIAIMGDFNAVSREDEAYHDQRIVDFIKNWQESDPRVRDLVNGKPDYSVMDIIREAGYRDTFWLKFKEHTGTFPTKKYGDPVPRRIDFIWVNGALAEKLVSCTVIKDPVTDNLSDHYPVMAVFELK